MKSIHIQQKTDRECQYVQTHVFLFTWGQAGFCCEGSEKQALYLYPQNVLLDKIY